ncbi:MAG: NYN domain-containing protein [Rhodobacteraceae bacterium]|nr:NYN domain-containing protein [Paracoccaceae bacterium]
MKAAVFIDGGHLRVLVRQAGHRYDPDCIEAVAHACVAEDETLLRILYYDCAPYQGNPKLPVSGKRTQFQGSDEWLKVLAAKSLFAVRLGTLKFRGFEPKRTPIASATLSDEDFKPRFEQKGVDMRIGLDIASYADDRSIDKIILVTGDTDCLPAMKRARTAGLQVVLVQFPKQRFAKELLWHSDFQRPVVWPRQNPQETHG